MLAGTHSGISIVNGKLNYPISGYPSTQFEIGNEVLMITFAPMLSLKGLSQNLYFS